MEAKLKAMVTAVAEVKGMGHAAEVTVDVVVEIADR